MHSTVYPKNEPEKHFQASSQNDVHKYIVVHLRKSDTTGPKPFFEELELAVATRAVGKQTPKGRTYDELRSVLGMDDSFKLAQILEFIKDPATTDTHDTRMSILKSQDVEEADDVWLAAGSRADPSIGKEDDLVLCKLNVHPSELGPEKRSGAEERQARGVFDWEEMILVSGYGAPLRKWFRAYEPVERLLCNSSEDPWDGEVMGTW